MEFSTIILEKEEGVARITLNRPEALNAISLELISEIGVAVDDADKDESIKAIVIAAKGRAFSAGVDLKAMTETLDSPQGIENFLWSWHRTFRRLEESSSQ